MLNAISDCPSTITGFARAASGSSNNNAMERGRLISRPTIAVSGARPHA
jgi:hypothetical protein